MQWADKKDGKLRSNPFLDYVSYIFLAVFLSSMLEACLTEAIWCISAFRLYLSHCYEVLSIQFIRAMASCEVFLLALSMVLLIIVYLLCGWQHLFPGFRHYLCFLNHCKLCLLTNRCEWTKMHCKIGMANVNFNLNLLFIWSLNYSSTFFFSSFLFMQSNMHNIVVCRNLQRGSFLEVGCGGCLTCS